MCCCITFCQATRSYVPRKFENKIHRCFLSLWSQWSPIDCFPATSSQEKMQPSSLANSLRHSLRHCSSLNHPCEAFRPFLLLEDEVGQPQPLPRWRLLQWLRQKEGRTEGTAVECINTWTSLYKSLFFVDIYV